MDLFAEIADERRELAGLLAGLTADQLATPSLCAGWTVHEVAAHLVMPMEVSTGRFLLTILACAGSFDRANDRLTRQQARRPPAEIVGLLHDRAASRFTPPGSGAEAPLTDLLVHGADLRWPLDLSRDVPGHRVRTALDFVTSRSGRGLVPRGALRGLRLEADDLDWSSGSGPTVRGDAEALLLAATGRTAALERLNGDGLPTLRARLLGPGR